MRYSPDHDAWITEKGNTMTNTEIVFSGLDDLAKSMAWPSTLVSRSVSHIHDWGAHVERQAMRLGKKPKSGELRVTVILERLIDEQSESTLAIDGPEATIKLKTLKEWLDS